MDLGAMKSAAMQGMGRLCVPVGIVVVVLGVVDGCWWVIWDEGLLGRLAMGRVRIVVPCVGHGGEGEEQSPLDDDGEGIISLAMETSVLS